MNTAYTNRLHELTKLSAGLDAVHAALAPLLVQVGNEVVPAQARPDGWISALRFGDLRWRLIESAEPERYYVLDVRGRRGARGADITTPEACTMHVVAGTMLIWRPGREPRYVAYGPAHPSSRCELAPGERRSWIIAQDCQLFNIFHFLPPA